MTRTALTALVARAVVLVVAAALVSASGCRLLGGDVACDGPGTCPSNQTCAGDVCVPGDDPPVDDDAGAPAGEGEGEGEACAVGACPVTFFATDETKASGLVVAGGDVLWAIAEADGCIRARPVDATSDARDVACDPFGAPVWLAVDGAHVYWTTDVGNVNDAVFRAPIGGSPATPPEALDADGLGDVVAAGRSVYAIAADDGVVAWLTRNRGGDLNLRVRDLTADGGVAGYATDGASPEVLHVGAGGTFAWAEPTSTAGRFAVWSRTTTVGPILVETYEGGAPSAVVGDAVDVYFATEADGATPAAVYRSDAAGTDLTAFVTDASDGQAGSYPWALALDDDYLYWVTYGGATYALYRAPRSNGVPHLLVDDLLDPISVAVDDDFIYWTEWGASAVKRMPKPAP